MFPAVGRAHVNTILEFIFSTNATVSPMKGAHLVVLFQVILLLCVLNLVLILKRDKPKTVESTPVEPTPSNIITIESEEELFRLFRFGESTFEGKTIQLANDLAFTWETQHELPLGFSTNTPFSGTLDGCNYKIEMAYTSNVNLFYRLDGAVLKNVTIESIAAPVSKYANGVTTFENVNVLSSFNTGYDGPQGSLVGHFADEDGHLTIKSCAVIMKTVQYKSTFCGGLVGVADGAVTIKDTEVEYCFMSALSSNMVVGGLVGSSSRLEAEGVKVALSVIVETPQDLVIGGMCGQCTQPIEDGYCDVEESAVTWNNHGDEGNNTVYGGIVGQAAVPVHVLNTTVVATDMRADKASGFVGQTLYGQRIIWVTDSVLDGTIQSSQAVYGVSDVADFVKNVVVGADLQSGQPNGVYILAKECHHCSRNYASESLIKRAQDGADIMKV